MLGESKYVRGKTMPKEGAMSCYELSVILPPVCTEACEREKSLPQNRVMEAMFDRKTRLEFQPRRRQLS